MSDAHTREHEYHLVDPSPWPIIMSFGALVLTGGAVVGMHGGTWAIAALGMAVILYTMFTWWRDVVIEGEHKGDHTPVVQLSLRYGMILFIASEVMFFVAWFWAFFNASLAPNEAIGGAWPPAGIETLDPWHLPLVNTIILLLSGTTVTWAHHALQKGDRKGLVQGLLCTVALGLSFTFIQGYEYIHATFSITDGIYGSTFFMATGFHGFHVIVGTIFLTVNLLRALKGHFKPEHHFGFEAAAWYWHFVDVVWLFLFCAVYIWGGGSLG